MYEASDLAKQLADTQAALVFVAIVTVLLACAWMAEDKVVDAVQAKVKADDPTCPIHKGARSQCDRYHRDD